MGHPHSTIAMCCLVCAITGCAGPGVAPQKQVTNDWRQRWIEPTKDRPIALNRTERGFYDLRFRGDDGQVRTIITTESPHIALSISPNARIAASVSFDPTTGVRFVTFFDRFGEVQSHVLLPRMPAAAKSLFFHGQSVVLSDSGEAVITLTHSPFVDVVRPPGEGPEGLNEMFFAGTSGGMIPIAASRDEGVQVLLPPSGGLALLRVHTNYSTGAKRTRWTLERYAKGFTLTWKKDGEAYHAGPAGYKYDVSLSVYLLSEAGGRHEYLHFKSDGSVEIQPIVPTTQPKTR